MQREAQIRIARSLLQHLERGTTATSENIDHNPVTAYTDPELLRRERARLFRDGPLVVGLSCQIPKAGDYLTDDFSGVPILVVRAEDGEARAFLNVCRHRGAKVVGEATGSVAKRFVCPYHNWSYDLCGKLTGVPHGEGFPNLDLETHGLRPLPLCEKYGMLWVCPSPDGDPQLDIDAQLAGLGPELESYDFSGYHFYQTRILRRRMNWKIAVDTFLEPYHLGALHRQTVGPIFVPNLCHFEAFGPNLRVTYARRTIRELANVPESDWSLLDHSAVVYVLFPNTVLVMQIDHLETWRAYPDGDRTDRCVLYADFFVPKPVTTESAREHWDRNVDLAVRTVEEEDFPVGESIQAGFASGAQTHLTYGRSEPALAHYERSVRAALEQG